MAAYTTLDTNGLLPGEPWTSAKALAVYENPIAITEGASGAPKIQDAALQFSGASTAGRDWVVSRYLLAPTDGLGTFAFARWDGTGTVNFGDNVAGSTLRPANAEGSFSGGPLNGTWRCLGHVDDQFSDDRRTTLWFKVAT